MVKSFLLIIYLYAAGGCHSNNPQILTEYKKYQFDSSVIEKLPVYDSLVSAILKQMPVFQQYFDPNDSYPTFSYMPSSLEPEVYKRLPAEAGTEIDQFFRILGEQYLYGFDLYKDSSIKIFVRRRVIDSISINIEENLSFYPPGIKMKQRTFPDTGRVINSSWQIWARFSEPDLF